MKYFYCALLSVLLILPSHVYANQYWATYSKNLEKEQKHLEKLPYIEPFVKEYLQSRIYMAQSLCSITTQRQPNDTTALQTLQNILTLCRNSDAINTTKNAINDSHRFVKITSNDILIIHTELILAAFFNELKKDPGNKPFMYKSSNDILAQCTSYHDLTASIRWHEIMQQEAYLKQRENIKSAIQILTNSRLDDNDTIGLQVLSLIQKYEKGFKPDYTFTPSRTAQGIITYQIQIPHCFDYKKAIDEITKIREAIVTEKNSQILGEIQSIAQSYITPVQEEIKKQDKLIATMKSTDGVAIENEESYTAFVTYFKSQSINLSHYARLNELYCKLMILQKPAVDYIARNKHIYDLASQLHAYAQSCGAYIKPAVSDIISVIDILKAFIYIDCPDKNNVSATATLNALHSIKIQLQELSAQKNEMLNVSLCNRDVSMNIETLEKGIALFNSHNFAKEALNRYSSVINQAIDEAQKEYGSPLVQKIVSMRSVIPFVKQFDIQRIMNEYSSKQYLLRKLRADSATLLQRIQSYQKKGIRIQDYQKAKELDEKIKALQPLYTINAGKYSINQNNIIIIDKQCAAMLARMRKNNYSLSSVEYTIEK